MIYSVKYFALQKEKGGRSMFEKNMRLPYLLDLYGSLLTERKRELLGYYYDEDYSLSEIAELTGLSRQGVRDSIKKSEAELFNFEDKLKLSEKNELLEQKAEEAQNFIDEIRKLSEKSSPELENLLDALSQTISEIVRL